MYKAFDEYITDDKAIKQLSEQRSIGYDVLEKSFDIVKKFILAKKRIIYGGMSIDMALKAAGEEGIYAVDAIPDYDFMSPDAYADSIELADALFREFGDVGIDSINALHPTTRRVRINFVPVADITYIPTNTFDRLPTLVYKGFRVIHPTFQRLDMHRAFCNPLENVPREVVFFRTNKDIKRFGLLDNAYPLKRPSLNTQEKIDLTIPTKYFEAGLIGGALAHALVGSSEFNVTKNGDTINVNVPKILTNLFRQIVIINDDPVRIRDMIVADLGGDVKYYNKFQDDIRPPSIVVETDEWIFDIHDGKGRLIPYTNLDNLKIVSHHGILLNYLERHFNADKYNQEWLWLYCTLLEEMKTNPVTMTDLVYGFYNWSLPYLVNAQKQYAQIEGYELSQARPPSRYNPADEKKPQDWDPSTSWVFATDGSARDDFKELTLRIEKK